MRRWFPWGSYFSRVRTSSLSSKPLSWWLLFGIGTPIESLNLKYLNPRYGKQSTHAVLTEPSQPFYLSAVVVTGKQVRNGKGSDGTLPQTSDQWPIGRTCNKVLGLLGCFGWRSLLLAQPTRDQPMHTNERICPTCPTCGTILSIDTSQSWTRIECPSVRCRRVSQPEEVLL